MPTNNELPINAKGQRPQFFQDPAMDKLLAIIMALAGEVAVQRDRNDTLERLIDDKGLITRNEVDGYRPTAEVQEERNAWRSEYLSHILRVIDVEADDMGQNDTSSEWQAVMDSIEE